MWIARKVMAADGATEPKGQAEHEQGYDQGCETVSIDRVCYIFLEKGSVDVVGLWPKRSSAFCTECPLIRSGPSR